VGRATVRFPAVPTWARECPVPCRAHVGTRALVPDRDCPVPGRAHVDTRLSGSRPCPRGHATVRFSAVPTWARECPVPCRAHVGTRLSGRAHAGTRARGCTWSGMRSTPRCRGPCADRVARRRVTVTEPKETAIKISCRLTIREIGTDDHVASWLPELSR